jgi:predicted nucleic acid-binding protein
MLSGAMWSGGSGVPETISDTGPILHLQEIDQLPFLAIVSPLGIPGLVRAELAAYQIHLADLEKAGLEVVVHSVLESEWQEVLLTPELSRIQPADAQVFVLARSRSFQPLTLTDDLALRKLLEGEGVTVVGTIGLLIRTYREGKVDRNTLERCIDDLFDRSTLHLSRGFRVYVLQLVKELS